MKLAIGAAVVALMGTAASASSLINIDFSTDFTSPAATYGAASGQTGFWNAIPAMTGGAGIALNDISGGASGASITAATTQFDFSFNNAGTSGDDEALMDDFLDLGGTGALDTFTVTGLAAGNYQVYVYAWGADDGTFSTGVSVNGSAQQASGGVWPGGFAAGVTHNVFNVSLASGQPLVIDTATLNGFGSLNGIQIIPTPGALALFGMGGLAASRRRR